MSDIALTAAQVLWEERLALARTAPPSALTNPCTTGTSWVQEAKSKAAETARVRSTEIIELYRSLNQDNHWALCLSGGGIRSAAFALGVLQRFASQSITPKQSTDPPGSVLQQFEYLSTVSGGRLHRQLAFVWAVPTNEGNALRPVYRTAVAAPMRSWRRSLVEQTIMRSSKQISNLRRDSHYLAKAIGFSVLKSPAERLSPVDALATQMSASRAGLTRRGDQEPRVGTR